MKTRRIVAGCLIVLGAVLMVFAPDSPGGVALVVIGIVTELVGITLERRDQK